MKKRPWLLWMILWVLGMFLITIKNRIAMGVGINFGELIVLNMVLDIIVIPVSIVFYYIMRFILNLVGAKNFLEGPNSLRNVALVWLVLFILVFTIPIFK